MLRLAALLVAAILMTGCSGTTTSKKSDEADKEAKEKKEAAEKAAKDAEKAAKEARNTHKAEAEKILADEQKRLDDWDKRVKAEADAAKKAKMQKAYDDAKAKHDALKKDLDSFNAAAGDAWDKLKDGLKKAGDETTKAFSKAADEFK